MINWFAINTHPINTIWTPVNIIGAEKPVSSFTSSAETKYSLVTENWEYFSLNNFCIRNYWYWNFVDTHDLENLSSKEIIKTSFPIRDWWRFEWILFKEKILNIKWYFITETRSDLELELRKIKSLLNQSWLRIEKKELDRTSYINVEIEDIKFNKLSTRQTDFEISLISLDPNFKLENPIEKRFEELSWNFQSTQYFTSSEHEFDLKTLIYIANTPSNITEIEVIIDWYPIVITENISSWDLIILDWKTSSIYINDAETENWSGQFLPVKINKFTEISINFAWAVPDNYSVYLYNDFIVL